MKRGSFVVGTLTCLAEGKSETAKIGLTSFSFREIPKKNRKFKEGDKVRVEFPYNNHYYAQSIEVIKSEEEEMEKDITINQEGLDEKKREILRQMMIENTKAAVELYHITATYDDTKKDLVAITKTVMDIATAITIHIDSQTTQYIKKE